MEIIANFFPRFLSRTAVTIRATPRDSASLTPETEPDPATPAPSIEAETEGR